MNESQFSFERFLAGTTEDRVALSTDLCDALAEKVSLQLGPLMESVIKELQHQGHELALEGPWSVGEFSYSDPTLGVRGLRVAFDLVVSVGFADRTTVDECD